MGGWVGMGGLSKKDVCCFETSPQATIKKLAIFKIIFSKRCFTE